MIDKKTRIKLRSLAMTINPVVWIGKDGFDEKAMKQISDELYNHELKNDFNKKTISSNKKTVTSDNKTISYDKKTVFLYKKTI